MPRRARITAMGLLALLFGCRERAGAWRMVDGTLRYRDLPVQVDGIDAATFEPLDDHHARDARRVYYGTTRRRSDEYFLVKRGVAWPLENADPATFTVLTGGYAKDARQVWHDGEAFAVRDPSSFEVLYHSGYARDRLVGYYMQAEVPGSDGRTFEALSDHVARDRAHVWWSDLETHGGATAPAPVNTVIADADRGTFAVFDGGPYARDARGIFYRATRLADADPATFRLLPMGTSGADAEDARGRFDRGVRLP
jgi:hypothetical protein